MTLRTPLTHVHHLWVWLRDRQNRLWVTPLLTGLAAVALAFSANPIGLLAGDGLPDISQQTVDDLLAVIASSMLALAIFALATLVAALSAASAATTPRSTNLLMGDGAARSTVGSFVGAFIFAIVSRTALGTGYYGPAGRFVLFVSTLAVVAFVVLRLLLWIRAGSQLGRLGDTLERIAAVTRRALQEQARRPWMGAAPAPSTEPAASALRPATSGYITRINLAGLQNLAASSNLRVHVKVRPGCRVDPDAVLAGIEGSATDACMDELRACFIIGMERTFDEDARFGLIVLAEVALRALSPSVNDPGTAIQVMSVSTGLLVEHARRARALPDTPGAVVFDRLTAPACDEAEMVADAYQPIGRDGAGSLEVVVRMQKMLSALVRNSDGDIARAARGQARQSLDRALARLDYAPDRERIAGLHESLFG